MDKKHENLTDEELRALEELEKELKDAYKYVIRNSLVKEYEANKDKTGSLTDPDAELNNLDTLDELRDYALNYCMDDLREIPGAENIEINKDNIKEAENLFDAAVHDWYLNEYIYLENTDGRIAEEKIEDEQNEPQRYTGEEIPEFDASSQPVPEEDKSNEKDARNERLDNARRHYIAGHPELDGDMDDIGDDTVLKWYADEVFEARCAYLLDGEPELSQKDLAKYVEENEKIIPDDERAWELYHDEYLIPMREMQKEAEEAAEIPADEELEQKVLADEQARKERDAKLDKEQEKIKKEIAEREALAEKRKKLREEALKRAEESKKAKSEIKDAPANRKTAEEIAAERAEAEKLERFLEENEVRYKKVRPDAEELKGIRSSLDELQKNASSASAFGNTTAADENIRRIKNVRGEELHKNVKPETTVRTASVKDKPLDMKNVRGERNELQKNASSASAFRNTTAASEDTKHIKNVRDEVIISQSLAENKKQNIDPAKYNAALRELAGSLNDTGSIFSWDSKEFTTMRNYLKAVSGIDLSARQLGQAFNAIREGVEAYREHAKADPRPDNKRRSDRLNVMDSLVTLADCYDESIGDPKDMFRISADRMVVDVLSKNIKTGESKDLIGKKVARSESYRKYMDGISISEMNRIAKDPKAAGNTIAAVHNSVVKAKENKADNGEKAKDQEDNIWSL